MLEKEIKWKSKSPFQIELLPKMENKVICKILEDFSSIMKIIYAFLLKYI